jgi:hypothetical protein
MTVCISKYRPHLIFLYIIHFPALKRSLQVGSLFLIPLSQGDLIHIHAFKCHLLANHHICLYANLHFQLSTGHFSLFVSYHPPHLLRYILLYLNYLCPPPPKIFLLKNLYFSIFSILVIMSF